MEGLEDQAPLRPAPFRSMEIDDEGGPTTIQSETTSGAMAAWAGNDRQGLASPRPGLTDNPQHSFISFPTSDGDEESAGHPTFPTSSRFPRTESQARFDSNAPIPSPLAGVRYQSKMAQSATLLDEMLRLDEGGRPGALSTRCVQPRTKTLFPLLIKTLDVLLQRTLAQDLWPLSRALSNDP